MSGMGGDATFEHDFGLDGASDRIRDTRAFDLMRAFAAYGIDSRSERDKSDLDDQDTDSEDDDE